MTKYLSHSNCLGHIFWHYRGDQYWLVSSSNSQRYNWRYLPPYSRLAAPYTFSDAMRANLELTNQYNALKEFLKDTVRNLIN